MDNDKAMSEATNVPAKRPPWLLPGLALAVLLVVAGAYVWRFHPFARPFVGTVLSDRQAAADFTLTDQLGRTQTLSGFRGKPVVVTFIYTNCPDLCPLIATNLHLAYQRLGDRAKQVALVAVTVDPEFDSVEQIRRFSDARRLTDEWFFLTGTRPELERVWQDYGVLAQPMPTIKPAAGAPGHEEAPGQSQATPELLEHSAPVFLLDKRGNVRVLLPPDFQADDLVTDLRLLLDES